jgi:hypothetical protein
MPQAIDLLRQGKKDQIWTKYCGFLDLNPDEFMQIQEHLLMEQINLISKTEVGKRIMGDKIPESMDQFRQWVPLTTYDCYETLLDRDTGVYQDAYMWSHTSGRSGKFKWIPYTRRAFEKLGERVMAGIILASARKKGEFRLEEHDVLVYNTPPRPYVSGIVLKTLEEQFNFEFVPDPSKTEQMDFQERIQSGFQVGMDKGIDILGSISSVLVKMGERFAEGANKTKLSKEMLKPRVLLRMIKGFISSKIAHRNVLPKDLWKFKALLCGGADTAIYKDKITNYWGVEPYEQYGCAEEGAIATQAWNKKYMIFFPDAAFFEFIPEEEWNIWRSNPLYVPKTVLFNEVQPKKKYELVLTNFYGKPLLRYRTFDLIEFPVLRDVEAGINLPQMAFVGRTNEFIDLAGFTGLIDEKMVWRAINNTGINYNEWSIRKETEGGEPILRLYMETVGQNDQETVQRKVHQALKDINSFYADYEALIAKPSLDVKLLNPGTFQAYMKEKVLAGADLAHLKPPHMNASDDIIHLLLQLDDTRKGTQN